MAIDTPARHIYSGDGSTRVFPIPTYIQGDDYIRIEINGVHQVDRSKWDIVNNSIIFVTAPITTATIDVQVATSVEALSELGNVTNVDIVAGNIVSINGIASNLDKILEADNNATIATTKASEALASAVVATTKASEASASATSALASATIATNKANESSTSASTATTKASEASTSASTATTKASEASVSATSASTSANQALTSRNQAETFAQQAKASAKLVNSIAELKLINGSNDDKLEVFGYYEKGDGGGGLFYWDGTSTEADNGGTIIQATGITTGRWKRAYSGAVNVKWFGAVGNDDGLGGGTDSTIAINSACTLCLSSGESLEFPTGNYKVTDTITLENEEFVKSFSLYGQNGNSTRIYFYNSISLKDLFFVDTNVNYLHIRDIEFIDVNRRTSRGFYFRDITPDSDGALPSWKHKFENVRIYGFKEGVRFDGDTADYLRDAHCSEVMFIHSKIRNCETALIYNNIQAVNHQLIGLDIENDEETASDEWTCIKFERGSTVNHIGGSVIGNGSYIEYKYSEAGGFQDTAQFSANGVRIEKRGGVSPVINHNTNSTIVLSNSFRIILENIPIITPITSNVFGRFGGKTFVKFTNVHANNPMVVEAYITSKLSANVEYGSIQIIDCDKISYSRVSNINAYGGTAILASNYRAIPASINYKNEGKQTSVDGDGYINIEKPTQKIYSGYWEVSEIKTLTFSAYDTSGLGLGVNPYTELIKLPLYGRPCKFKILRDDINAGASFVLDLYIVVSGVDHLVASITPTPNVAGYFESNIQTNTGIPLAKFINDGVIWDGKMKIVKSGTVNGFIGLVMIDYM